jgi:hypothetical protein
MTRSYPEETDCVWLASDRDGHVGTFVTAGSGPIPVDVLDAAAFAIEDIEGRVCSLPRTSEVQLLCSVKRPDDFIAMAERGFYVYDWTDVYRAAREEIGGYELVAVPLRPILARELAPEIAEVAAVANLSGVSFATERVLDVRKYLRCREAE